MTYSPSFSTMIADFRLGKSFATALFAVGTFALLTTALKDPARAANGSVTYTYDALGRISTVSYDTGVFIIYTYDANGNRTSQTINVNGTVGSWGGFSWGAALW